MKKTSILAIWLIIPFTGCGSDGNSHRSAAVPTPLAGRVISDATSAREPAKSEDVEGGVTKSRFDEALELQSGVYGLPFGATTDEVMKWCADNNMAVANPTERDVKEAAREAVSKIADLKEAYDFETAFLTPLEQELLNLAQGYADIGNELEHAKVTAAQEKLDALKNPTVPYEGQKYYLGQVHKAMNVNVDNEQKVCTDERICKTAYVLLLRPTEKSEKIVTNNLIYLFVFLYADIGQELRTYATLATFGGTRERSARVQFEILLKGMCQKYGTPMFVARRTRDERLEDEVERIVGPDLAAVFNGLPKRVWARNLLLLGDSPDEGQCFAVLYYQQNAATRISDLHSTTLADFEKNYHEKKKEALAQIQQNF